MLAGRGLRRDDSRVVIHFDYDCFYASVVENENPALKSVPLAIQQKQIIVTCNYEARRRGLRKLQLITEAKRICPEAVIIQGEDLTRFRNASKELYNFLRSAIWSDRAERLGFDEVWLDCTDMIEYNLLLLNPHDLVHSFFCMDKADPTNGFPYDATGVFGPVFQGDAGLVEEHALHGIHNDLHLRLILGSHLAKYLRHELEFQRGYTATVGIATNKLISKLVGNVNKPKNQTTMMPPYGDTADADSNITQFMDAHDIGKVPGIGFKLANKIRTAILGRAPVFDKGLIYGGTAENVTVRDVRLFSGMGAEMLEDILGGPGAQKGIGGKVWGLVNGIDDSEVGKAKTVPTQISQEDSYMKYLRTFEQVKDQLLLLAERLIRRMHIDLMEEDELDGSATEKRRWLAHPRTLRLSTRPRTPFSPDDTRPRTFHRISRSAPVPNFIFSQSEGEGPIAQRLVEETLIPMFRKLHPDRTGWNLSLVNIAVTNMAETAADSKDSKGRDIGRMFKQQDDVLRDFRVIEGESPTDEDMPDSETPESHSPSGIDGGTTGPGTDPWDTDEAADEATHKCVHCQASVPLFAVAAHQRYHASSD